MKKRDILTHSGIVLDMMSDSMYERFMF